MSIVTPCVQGRVSDCSQDGVGFAKSEAHYGAL